MEVKSISKEFKEGVAIDNISFNVDNRKIIGFVGHNGSGKTVLLNVFVDFTRLQR